MPDPVIPRISAGARSRNIELSILKRVRDVLAAWVLPWVVMTPAYANINWDQSNWTPQSEIGDGKSYKFPYWVEFKFVRAMASKEGRNWLNVEVRGIVQGDSFKYGPRLIRDDLLDLLNCNNHIEIFDFGRDVKALSEDDAETTGMGCVVQIAKRNKLEDEIIWVPTMEGVMGCNLTYVIAPSGSKEFVS